ncbi:MAG: cation:proton antiporter [Gammaproteobacteria bacterium]|jgi:Kef-type K+ transport system membrane component KefB|nr:cation:proton antiporter [Gammaproteobacteria bacterium]
MYGDSVVFSFFLIFAGASVLATLSLYFRQPILIAYILLGGLLGPYGLSWIADTALLEDVSHVGIMFLLFLIGLDMQPTHLLSMLKQGSWVAIASSLIFATTGYAGAWIFGFSHIDCLIIGAATMFSSTIIGIKLLPTTVLHHKQTGEMVVGLLLLQDLIAIVLLIVVTATADFNSDASAIIYSLFGLPVLVAASLIIVRWILLPLITRFDRFHEYIFLLAIGWCLACAETASMVGLSAEIGAFIGGVSLASSPISQYIAINLKPIRDFFLVLFFFSIGAGFNINIIPDIWLSTILMSLLVMLVKPAAFGWLVRPLCRQQNTRWEVGFRLGQTSEFSILLAALAWSTGLISEAAAMLIQATAIVTFITSSYLVVWFFKSPIAIKDHLRHD